MNNMFQFYLVIDHFSVVQSAQYLSDEPHTPEGDSIYHWVGLSLGKIPGTHWDLNSKTLIWNELHYHLEEFSPLPNTTVLLVYEASHREQLLEAALDFVPDGIQIFDTDSSIVFFNSSSKQMHDIPLEDTVERMKLLDFFDLDPDYSTTLTALRTRTALRGRFDTYKSITGKELSTVSAAFPIFRDNKLIGALSLERDLKIAQRLVNEILPIEQTLLRKLSDTAGSKTTRYTLDDLIGNCPELVNAKELASKMATKEANILIQGETGTGKEIFAQGIHALSPRCNHKFVAVNCAAFPESLIEGMLFGTVKGAFTGSSDKMGLIEEANHGTLFLDELNSMSLGMQAKILRVLQEKTIQRIGSTKNIPIDVRVISACNEDAFALSESGKLRPDLFYRLASIVIEIPPLRQRKEDLETLTRHYIRQNQELCPHPISRIAEDFWARLHAYSWPGNVRELFHILYYAISDCEDGVLKEENLPAYFRNHLPEKATPPQRSGSTVAMDIDYSQGLSALVSEYERSLLLDAYNSCERNATQAAALLKISRQNFQYYMKKYNLNQ